MHSGQKVGRETLASPTIHRGGGSRAARLGTYHLLAVLGEGGLDEHGPQCEAQVVVRVADAELPAREAGLRGTGSSRGVGARPEPPTFPPLRDGVHQS